MEDVKNFLEGQICHDIEHLHELDLGSEEYSRAVAGIGIMCDKFTNIEKLEKEIEDKDFKRTTDEEYREKEFKLNMKTAVASMFVGVATVLSNELIRKDRNRWMREAFKFEETGTFRSDTGRPLRNSIFKW